MIQILKRSIQKETLDEAANNLGNYLRWCWGGRKDINVIRKSSQEIKSI